MKKIFLLSSLFFIISSFGYTNEDLATANMLADQGIIVKQTTTSGYRLDYTILRQEVIKMALGVKGIEIPADYTCKKYFADVTKNDWVCGVIETAADNGIITRSNRYANPGKDITRAEAFSVVYNASGIIPFRELAGFQILDKDAVLWQKDLFQRIHDSEISMPGEKYITSNTPAIPVYFYPNRLATRAEVFGFTRNILKNSSTSSYEGFTADFGGDVDISEGWYGFGDLGDLENIQVRAYHISIQPRKSAIIFGDQLMLDVLGKKYWNGNVYYTTMLSGMCYTGRLIFLTDEYIITASGACNQTILEVESALRSVSFDLTAKSSALQNKDVLMQYYKILGGGTSPQAYEMRSPAGVSLETFTSWYKNTDSVTFREDTLKDLGANTYEFLVDMTENNVKSTYKVKSKVNLEKFTIDNISSVKI